MRTEIGLGVNNSRDLDEQRFPYAYVEAAAVNWCKFITGFEGYKDGCKSNDGLSWTGVQCSELWRAMDLGSVRIQRIVLKNVFLSGFENFYSTNL